MRTFYQAGPLRAYLRGIRKEGQSVGFVPTMGALHEGHASLFRRSKSECDLVVASIFVNPTQFGPQEDFAAYPRDLDHDLQIAASEGVGAVFLPAVEEIYPPGFQTIVDVPELAATLEGAQRPGHFRGVATVVAKLLNIVQPDRAYFGQKDYQQLLIVEQMVRDLNIPTEIVTVPTQRAPDGLALSSRNAYLSSEERQAATVLYRAIQHAEEYIQKGQTDARNLLEQLEARIAAEPLASLQYLVLADPDTLQPVNSLEGAVTLLALAVRIGKTRLIDNALIAPPGIARVRHRVNPA